MEEHEEVHAEIRWRRVCAIFDDHPLWRAVNPEERKDVFEDVTFSLAKKERVGPLILVFMAPLHAWASCGKQMYVECVLLHMCSYHLRFE